MQQSECSEPSVDFFICLKVGPFLTIFGMKIDLG